jgi:hypothetical protein
VGDEAYSLLEAGARRGMPGETSERSVSTTISYFLNSEKSLTELSESISGCLGCSLKPYEGNDADLYGRFLAMEFSLHTAEGYENDRELNFEDFGYELGVRIPSPDGDLRLIALPTMLAIVLVLYHRLGVQGMLVHDTGLLLARYEARADGKNNCELFDLVSGKTFDDFPRHLTEVQARIARSD